MKNVLLLFILLIIISFQLSAQEKVIFPSKDGLKITAEKYFSHPTTAPLIILFHQAGWSRGEYLEIAPKLNKLGYNCIAIDQRSGGEINGVINETHQRAAAKKLPTQYVDAEKDMIAAIRYTKSKYAMARKIIVWGSSYSSALALKIAGDARVEVNGVLAFAPGEYFESMGESANFIGESAQNIMVPTFITSAKSEKQNWWKIYESIPAIGKDYFLPKTEGQHGSRALWEKFPEHKEYWQAVEVFLKTL
ncbi:MAG: alpha/beta hydrolase [Vicingaceae bacterium]|nr:alpha/beta hydrolase [Vicingaceae bacterium]